MTFVLQGREEMVQVEQTSPINEQHWPTYPFLLYRWRAVHLKGNCDIFNFQSNLAIMFPLYLEDEQEGAWWKKAQ